MLTNDVKENILKAVEKKIKGLTCPMCQNKTFIIADGYIINSLQADLTSFSFGGPAIPTIGFICKNCGFVSQHSLGVLGLLPKQKNEKDDSSK